MATLHTRWQGCRNRIILALLLLCLLCALLCGLFHTRVHAADTPGWDVILILDQSYSMGGPGRAGSDPEQLRLAAAQLFISYLGLAEYPTPHRLALIYFGGESILAQPLTALAHPADRELLREQLAAARLLGWTDPLGALQLAYQELYFSERAQAGRPAAIILLTDGQPELPTLDTPAARAAYALELRELATTLHQHGCALFTIALTPAAMTADPTLPSAYQNLWQELAALAPPGAYYPVATADALPQVYHHITARLLGSVETAPQATLQVAQPLTHTFAVAPGLSQLALTFFKSDRAIRLTLYRPGGALARETDPDIRRWGGGGQTHAEIWVIEQPHAGWWQVYLSGQGTVQLWQAAQAAPPEPVYQLHIADLPAYQPAGSPFQAEVQLHSADGSAWLPDMQVVAELSRAGLPELTLLARAASEPGAYRLESAALPAGAYTLRVRALLPGRALQTAEAAFEIIQLPEVAWAPMVAAHDCLLAGEVLTLTGKVQGDWATIAHLARRPDLGPQLLLAGPGALIATLPLTLTPTGAFYSAPLSLTAPGQYTLTLMLTGQTVQGLQFATHAQHRLAVTALPAAPAPPLRHAAGWLWWGGSAALIVGAGAGMFFWRGRPRATLTGQWRIIQTPRGGGGGQIIALPPRERVALGGRAGLGSSYWSQPVADLQASRGPEGLPEIWVQPLLAGPELVCNERVLAAPQRLRDGDVLAVGGCRLRYENVQQAAQARAGVSRSTERRRSAWPIPRAE